MAEPIQRVIQLQPTMVRYGAPTKLDLSEAGAVAREAINVDVTEDGRLQGGPVARAIYEKGASGDTDWPLM